MKESPVLGVLDGLIVEVDYESGDLFANCFYYDKSTGATHQFIVSKNYLEPVTETYPDILVVKRDQIGDLRWLVAGTEVIVDSENDGLCDCHTFSISGVRRTFFIARSELRHKHEPDYESDLKPKGLRDLRWDDVVVDSFGICKVVVGVLKPGLYIMASDQEFMDDAQIYSWKMLEDCGYLYSPSQVILDLKAKHQELMAQANQIKGQLRLLKNKKG